MEAKRTYLGKQQDNLAAIQAEAQRMEQLMSD